MSSRLRDLVEALEDAKAEGTMTEEEAVEIYCENIERIIKESEDEKYN